MSESMSLSSWKNGRLAICTIVLLALSLGIVATQAAATTTDLVVLIKGLRGNKGEVGCQVFGSAKGFPSETALAKAGMYVTIEKGTAQCTFKSLPPGTYAVTVFHDENGNKIVDKNVFGAPTEGYGVSNNHTYAMSPPKWEESKFDFAAESQQSITIELRY